jgi:hypothetical protein
VRDSVVLFLFLFALDSVPVLRDIEELVEVGGGVDAEGRVDEGRVDKEEGRVDEEADTGVGVLEVEAESKFEV